MHNCWGSYDPSKKNTLRYKYNAVCEKLELEKAKSSRLQEDIEILERHNAKLRGRIRRETSIRSRRQRKTRQVSK